MKHVHGYEFMELQGFVAEAKQHFEANPSSLSYTTDDVVSGCLFAMRWGMDKDSMLVFKLSEDMEPLVIGNIIGDQT